MIFGGHFDFFSILNFYKGCTFYVDYESPNGQYTTVYN